MSETKVSKLRPRVKISLKKMEPANLEHKNHTQKIDR